VCAKSQGEWVLHLLLVFGTRRFAILERFCSYGEDLCVQYEQEILSFGRGREVVV
jgi:hypothetical protein